MSREEFIKKLKDKYGDRVDIDFWAGFLYELYNEGEITMNRVYELCDEMVEANQYIQ